MSAKYGKTCHDRGSLVILGSKLQRTYEESRKHAECHYLYTQTQSSMSLQKPMVFVITASSFRLTANVKRDPCCHQFDMFLPGDIWF